MASENRIAITGITGFIGRGLPPLLAKRGFFLSGISRAGKAEMPGVDRWMKPDALDLSDHRAVINLAGEPVAQRWTEAAKKRFRNSRVDFTERIVDGIARLPEDRRPGVLVNASAVGFYGDRGDEILAENVGPGEGYLADLCRDWEAAALPAADLGVRVVRIRIGIVLGKGGEAFERLHGVFKWGFGGKLGNGRQWMPWIHVDDLREAIVHAVVSPTLEGAVNGTAPAPERNSDFTKQFARALHRPAILPVPALALRTGLGEFAGALLASQRAVPAALVSDGFGFRFPELGGAFENLLDRPE